MEPIVIGWIMLAVVVAFIIFGLPVAFAMFIAGALGHIFVVGWERTIFSIPIVFYDKMSWVVLLVVPLFILMGMFAWKSGYADDAFDAGAKWVSRLPGGLAQATIVAGAAFGAACGTTIASCAALAKTCVPAIRKAGIDEKLGLGAISAAAALSVMIPPSIIMPLYGIITETSIAPLLIAGIIPGVIAALIFMLLIFVMVKIKPQLAPTRPDVTWKERLLSLKKIWGIALLFFVVIGGIYSGLVTPSEAGGLGAFGALVIGVATKRLKKADIIESIEETVKISCTVLILTICALYFAHFLAQSRVPATVSIFLTSLPAPRLLILIGILLMYTVLGCILDTGSSMLLTMPIIFPAIISFGYSPIWFGVIIVQMVELGALTPPFGINLFIMKGSLPEVPTSTIIRSVVPFILTDFVILAIYVAFPQIALFLPNLMG